MRDTLGPTKPITIRMKVGCGRSDVEVDALASDSSQQRSIIVSPSQDLFVLQPDDPDMFNRFLFEDVIPDNTAQGLLQIPHVGWQYHPSWASSLHESSRIRSLDSLCYYIVYGARFGGLETLWLINYRIKRKHWVPSKEEFDGPKPKVFETDEFRLIEVEIDNNIRSSEQLPWDEVAESGDLYTGRFYCLCETAPSVSDPYTSVHPSSTDCQTRQEHQGSSVRRSSMIDRHNVKDGSPELCGRYDG
ncbi:hypothetical protein FNYG_15904 [Fusarium nygamai]|uniref:Uncharacterized protein n=1 Tax=Gibberella nygamai TaxID=42673 RepID=A0A2K0U0J1_GIBNY|nr:hypothetical protein FNYG_15904 [Fusarium nygamai]